MTDTATSIYQQQYPDFRLSIFQQEQIDATATNLEAWRETLAAWKLCGYSPRNIIGMFEKYEALAIKPKSNAHVGRHADDDAEPMEVAPEACPWCGKLWCLSNHDAERRQAA